MSADVVTIVANDVALTGGMERQLMRLVTGLLQRGFEVVVVTRRCDLKRHPHLKVVRVRAPSRPRSIAYPAFFVLASLAVARHRRGLLHTTGAVIGSRADLSTVHFCHHAYVRRVATSRQRRRGPLYSLNARIVARMAVAGERLCFRPSRTRHLVAVSRGAGLELVRYFSGYGDDISVIPNGVDRLVFRPDPEARASIRHDLGISPDARVAVFVGGEWERKGLHHVIDALADVDGWHLLVVGSGAQDIAQERAEKLGVGPRLHMAGRVANPERYLAAGDVFVLPTTYETFSMATFEAAACGLPLLNTPVSGAEEIVRDGTTGYKIDASATSVATGLRRLADPETRRRMGEAARDASAAYDWDAVVDEYVGLYGRLGR